MASPRIRQALERIDAALARIETQAALSRHAPQPAGSEEHQRLAARHEALRGSVTSSLAELDQLIAELER